MGMKQKKIGKKIKIRHVPETRLDNRSREVIIKNFTQGNAGGWNANITSADVAADLVRMGLADPPSQTERNPHAPAQTPNSIIETSMTRFRTILQHWFSSPHEQTDGGENMEIDFSKVVTPTVAPENAPQTKPDQALENITGKEASQVQKEQVHQAGRGDG